ncbi:lysis system i-spanin subunit Rz [Pseudomonas putida]|nr:lysis system i-spanin subunit Rz [Pseudomonas putida]MDQ2482816.1 lysis system i-spanin subunit Rz [Pseudomonas putida]
MTLNWRLACLALLLGSALGIRGTWLWQTNAYRSQLATQAADYDRQLSEKDRAYGRERETAADAALEQMVAERDRRAGLESRLQEQGQKHWKEMEDARKTQDRLRDQLATADLRLSVLLDASALAGQGCDGRLRETTGAGGMVHGVVHAELDRAHAQRIIDITDEGDRGLIALQACQAYLREIAK